MNDWDHYAAYDFAIFPGWDHDMEKARLQNPGIRVGLVDPKQSRLEFISAARAADFLMVSSLEQRDAFLRLNRNILIHYMFPDVPARERIHAASETLVVGYHGNRVHLECMQGGVQVALEQLARQRPVEFVMVYNLAAHGRARIGLPDTGLVPQRHVQWTADGFTDAIAGVDIGLVPAYLPIRDRASSLESTAVPEPEFCYEPFDYLLRYKASTNPGRIQPFARLGIPVIADATPSAAEFIEDGVSGRLALSPEGWFDALEQLAEAPALRQNLAKNLRTRIEKAYQEQVPRLLDFCAGLRPRPPVTLIGATGAEEDLRALSRYGKPRGPGLLAGLRRRLAGRRP